MPSVKKQSSIKRRQSASVLSDFSNRYHSVEIDYQPNVIYACFPDHGNLDETVIFDPSVKLYEVFENLLRKRGLNINDVDLLIENSNTPLPENTDAKFLAGQKIFVTSRSNMRVARHSRATHSMDDSPGDRPRRKMSEEAISRKSSFANSKMNMFQLSKSRQASENKLSGGSEDGPETKSIDGSLRELNIQEDNASCSNSDLQYPPDDGGTRRSRSVAPTRISLGIFGSRDRETLMNRLQTFKENSNLNYIPPSMELEASWKDIVTNSDKLSPRCEDQQRAIWELVETERNYILLLGTLLELKACAKSLRRDLLSKERDIDAEKIFMNCDNLHGIHRHYWEQTVWPMLDMSRRTGDPLNAAFLHEWFCSIENWSTEYQTCIQFHNEFLLYLQKKQKEVQLFAEFVAFAEQQFPDSYRRQKLSDTLTMPMQRLTRYPLLLRAILKHSSDHEEQVLLQGLIDRVEDATHRLNLELNNNDLKNKLVDIYRQIDGYDSIDQDEFEKLFRFKCQLDIRNPIPFVPQNPPSYRRVYHRGELKMKENGKLSTKVDIYCLLFTDLFLICKKKADRRLRIVRPPIHIMDLKLGPVQPDTNGFVVMNFNAFGTPSQLYIMLTNSVDETRRWQETIEQASCEFMRLLNMGDARHAPYGHEMHPMNEYRPSFGGMNYNSNRNSQADIVHRKSSSMDSQTVAAAHSHMEHMHRMAAVSSSSLDQLDRERRTARGVTPRHKLSIVSCTPNPLSCSKSSVDLHMALGAEAGFEGNRNRSRSNSSSGGKSRSPSLRRKLTEPSYHCSTPVRTGSEDSTKDSPIMTAPGEQDGTANPMTGRRFEKRYHTADDIDTKHNGKPNSIVKRFSLNVSNALGGSSRKISARMESSRRQSQVSQASTAASSESFGSSTSGISSASDGGFTVEVVPKPHISTIAVNESPAESTLNLDIYEKIMQEESTSGSDSGGSQRSPPAPPLPAIPPPLDKSSATAVTNNNNTVNAQPPVAPTANQTPSNPPDAGPCKQQEFLKFIFENQLETSEV